MENDIIEIKQAEMLAGITRSEIDIQIATAKQYPRDLNTVLNKIATYATMDRETAEDCFYVLRRKDANGNDNTIEGLSIRMAGLKDTIDNLEEGLDTKVEENGSRFSGGEKQRIAIARALLHNKNMLLLDEATSALDNECAREIEENILGLENITCIAVTHKLYSNALQKYDKIFVMDDGNIIEQGTFQELMEKSGAFQKLYAAGAAGSVL